MLITRLQILEMRLENSTINKTNRGRNPPLKTHTMNTQEQLLKECLESLSKLSKERLLEETEQLLLSLIEKSNTPLRNLTRLKDYYNKK